MKQPQFACRFNIHPSNKAIYAWIETPTDFYYFAFPRFSDLSSLQLYKSVVADKATIELKNNEKSIHRFAIQRRFNAQIEALKNLELQLELFGELY